MKLIKQLFYLLPNEIGIKIIYSKYSVNLVSISSLTQDLYLMNRPLRIFLSQIRIRSPIFMVKSSNLQDQ